MIASIKRSKTACLISLIHHLPLNSKNTDLYKGIKENMAKNQSDETRGAVAEALADISERLDQCHLNESMSMDGSKPFLTHSGSKGNETRTASITHSGPRMESTISNNQITLGRDMNSYQVNGPFIQVVQKYEGVLKENDNEILESRRNRIDNEECVSKDHMEAQSPNSIHISDVAASMTIPAPPPYMLERDAQHDQIVAKLLSINNARVAILGMGGIGKTSLACSVANDSQIEAAYQRRLFLSFEGCSTPDLAYTNLASAFQVPADRRSSHRQILSQVSAYLKQEKTVLIIDNFETFWEVSSNRRAADDLLAQLAALPKLALIVTLRGIQRPGNIRWVKIDPLQTLSKDGSMELLSIITDEEYNDSEYVQKLLNAVSGIPLAITLIGSLLRDESETPESLWAQWTRESARAIRVANDDSDDRLYKLDISLRLSIFGPRMNENAKASLAAFSILPTGINMDEEWLDRFQALLPDTIRVRDCIRVLRDVALVTLELSTTPARLRLLPPVRDFCLNNLCLDNDLSRRLIDIYNHDVEGHWDPGASENYVWITMEYSNITAILNHAITLRYVTEDFSWTACRYTEWRSFLCIPETDIIEGAVDILADHPIAKARCLQAFGSFLSDFNREKEALQQLELASAIHKEYGSQYEVGWTHYLLGCAHRRLNDYPNAEHYLLEARDLFTQIRDNRRKGSVLRSLSNTYLLQNKLPEAQEAAKEALELSTISGNRTGKANALGVLGDVYRKQGNYDLAVETLTVATDASKALNDIHGEACGNESLGVLYEVNKPDQAVMHYQLAISLFERAQDAESVDRVRTLLTQLEASPIISLADTS